MTLIVALVGAIAQDGLLPAGEGYTWLYDHKVNANAMGVQTSVKLELRMVCKKDGDAWRYGFFENEGLGEMKNKGWVRVKTEGSKIEVLEVNDKGHGVLLLPITPGKDGTRVEIKRGNGTIKIETQTAEQEETVETPAGKFTCTKVVAEYEVGGTKMKTSAWYAKGVGLVKEVWTVQTHGTTVDNEIALRKFDKEAKSSDRRGGKKEDEDDDEDEDEDDD